MDCCVHINRIKWAVLSEQVWNSGKKRSSLIQYIKLKSFCFLTILNQSIKNQVFYLCLVFSLNLCEASLPQTLVKSFLKIVSARPMISLHFSLAAGSSKQSPAGDLQRNEELSCFH